LNKEKGRRGNLNLASPPLFVQMELKSQDRPVPIAELVADAIDLAPDAKYGEFYLNPLFGKEISNLVPSFERGGFTIRVFEIEREDGMHISAELSHESGNFLDLGEIILTGEDALISKKRPLQPIARVINFIRSTVVDSQNNKT